MMLLRGGEKTLGNRRETEDVSFLRRVEPFSFRIDFLSVDFFSDGETFSCGGIRYFESNGMGIINSFLFLTSVVEVE